MTGHRLSRRGLLLGAVGAAAAGLLAACGDDGEGEPAGSGSSSAPAGGGSFPAGVTHQFGTTTVEAAPAAVVSLGWADADALLAMGVVPAGHPGLVPVLAAGRRPVGAGEAQRRHAAGAQGPGDQLGGGRRAAAGPDHVRQVGQRQGHLGTAGEAGPDAVRAGRHPAVRDHARTYTRGDGRVQFMEALGFTNSPEIEALKPANFYAEVSKERVGLLDADLTVMFGIGAGAELRKDTVLNSIPAAKAGRLLIIDDADLVNGFSTNSVLSTPYVIEKFVPMVKEALAS